MFRERPARILLAAAALVAVAVAQVVWYTASRLALVAQCGEACVGDFEPIQTFGASVVLLGLATALVVRPRVFRLPTAVASAGLAIPWIGPVIDGPRTASPELDLIALSLLSATPFLLAPPIGRGSSRWALAAWIGAMVLAALLFLLDQWGAGFMAATPPGLQVGFVLVLGVVLGAGLTSLGLRRTEPGEGASLIAPA